MNSKLVAEDRLCLKDNCDVCKLSFCLPTTDEQFSGKSARVSSSTFWWASSSTHSKELLLSFVCYPFWMLILKAFEESESILKVSTA